MNESKFACFQYKKHSDFCFIISQNKNASRNATKNVSGNKTVKKQTQAQQRAINQLILYRGVKLSAMLGFNASIFIKNVVFVKDIPG